MSGYVNSVISLSLWKEKNVSGDEFNLYGMSEAFQSFTAGILGHFPALISFL
jgi:glutamine synthetase